MGTSTSRSSSSSSRAARAARAASPPRPHARLAATAGLLVWRRALTRGAAALRHRAASAAEEARRRGLRTIALLGGLSALLILLGSALAPGAIWIFGAIAVALNLISYFFSDRIVLAMSRAHPIDRGIDPGLFAMVEELAGTAGIPTAWMIGALTLLAAGGLMVRVRETSASMVKGPGRTGGGADVDQRIAA